MVKVAKYLHKSEAAVHRCLQPFIEKRLFTSILFTKVAGLHPKERNSAGDLFVGCFRKLFLQNMTASAKCHSFFFVTSTSSAK